MATRLGWCCSVVAAIPGGSSEQPGLDPHGSDPPLTQYLLPAVRLRLGYAVVFLAVCAVADPGGRGGPAGSKATSETAADSAPK
jgi:hypothetical protein